MNSRHLLMAGLAAALAGCASGPKEVVFLTKTSFALDVAAQPAGASIGYDRVEGYIGPRFDNGSVPPLAASFVTNGKLFDRQIRQVYATGKAAEFVTVLGDQAMQIVPGQTPAKDEKTATMFFATGTTVGLKLGFGGGGVADWVTLGYKRREVSVIPITESEFPSVLATIDSDQEASSADRTQFGVGQYFATGVAAQAIANDTEVRRLFRHRIRDALGKVEREEKTQAETALSILSCVADLPDAELGRVFTHADTVKLFEKDIAGLPATLKAMAPDKARSTYARYVAAADGASPERGQAMSSHRTVVCAFAGR